MSLMTDNMSREFIEKVLSPDRTLMPALIFDLKEKGVEIGGKAPSERYSSMEEFFRSYDSGRSGLIALEGEAVRVGGIFAHRECLLRSLRLSLLNDKGRLPALYERVEEAYLKVYEGKAAILNPLCIVHQTALQTAARGIRIGHSPLLYRHIACRSQLTGKRVYSKDGVDIAEKMGMAQEKIEELLDNWECLYLLKISSGS